MRRPVNLTFLLVAFFALRGHQPAAQVKLAGETLSALLKGTRALLPPPVNELMIQMEAE